MNPLRHSVCRWCHPHIPLDTFARSVRELGYESIELLDPPDWPIVQAHGLTCALANGPGTISVGFNRREHHEGLVPAYRKHIAGCARHQIPALICFSGDRSGLDDETGLRNCAEGLLQLMPDAEEAGVTLVMELLNSRIDHPDYQCDRTAWGVELVRRIGSERFKLLYDIYHMQIMEGDVIRTIQTHHQSIGHYHTGGNPGRHEIDHTQELNYPAIMRAIHATGYQGFIGQEFIPTGDSLNSLRQAIDCCKV